MLTNIMSLAGTELFENKGMLMAVVTTAGVLVVFVVLILLIFIFYAYGGIFQAVTASSEKKKAAKAAGDKKVDLVAMKELLPLTGYIRGGCSPIGMKRKYPTFIDETAQLYDEIAVSAGMRGQQLLMAPDKLIHYADMKICDLTE